jgi:hypothetical protein
MLSVLASQWSALSVSLSLAIMSKGARYLVGACYGINPLSREENASGVVFQSQ